MNKGLYVRPNKPRTLTVKKRSGAPERALPSIEPITEVSRFTECHITPPEVSARMVDYLGGVDDLHVLDPQAGTGAYIQALCDKGYQSNKIVAVELDAKLCCVIRNRFNATYNIELVCNCFLEYAEQVKGKMFFPRIITNPPFKYIDKHIKAALSLLESSNDNSCALVALVPITYNHDNAELVELLPNDVFASTRVNTKIIRFRR